MARTEEVLRRVGAFLGAVLREALLLLRLPRQHEAELIAFVLLLAVPEPPRVGGRGVRQGRAVGAWGRGVREMGCVREVWGVRVREVGSVPEIGDGAGWREGR